jgi:acyl-CoA synthetase (AMP-forming)/AMP-acid ligase II
MSESITLLDGLRRQLRDRPDAAAFSVGPRTLSFAAVDAESARLAGALRALGVGPGDRVACLTRRHLECLLLTLAALRLGAVCMPVNWRLAAPEIAYIVDHGQAAFLMVDEAFVATVRQAGIAGPKAIVCTERAHDGLPGLADWSAAAAPLADAESHRAAPDDAALQLYSSGTTGLPKGVVLTHRGLISSARTVEEGWGFTPASVLGNPLPTFHVAGMTMLLQAVHSGCHSVLFADFDPAGFNAAIGEHRITHAFLVPAMLLFMLQAPGVARGDYASMRVIAYGGSPISERVLVDAMRTFGCRFLQTYGLTEVSGPGTFLMPEDHQPGGERAHLLRSAGKPAGGARLRIVDPQTRADLPEGEVGEIWIETVRNLREYWRNPQATAEAFPEGRNERGGWFRTGDAGYLKDGYLYIHDRVKDMIISGGENIYPAEVENLLMQHPAVADGAVIGVPDDTWGEAVKACVVLRPGEPATDLTAAAIVAFMRERMAHYKCPKSVDFVTTLPRNPSGKLLKRVLREPYWQGRGRQVA